jgi:hypothetical protein
MASPIRISRTGGLLATIIFWIGTHVITLCATLREAVKFTT